VTRLLGLPRVRVRVLEALEVGEPSRRITDAHLRGYNQSRPGWITGRISCLVTAVEILRTLEHREAAVAQARQAIEKHPASRRLVNECRYLQYQNYCH
jgi:hypothetical protein